MILTLARVDNFGGKRKSVLQREDKSIVFG